MLDNGDLPISGSEKNGEKIIDNVISMIIGVFLVLMAFALQSFGVEKYIGYIVIIGVSLLASVLIFLWTRDWRSIVTIVGLSLISIVILMLYERSDRPVLRITISGEVYLDENRNGVQDGTEVRLQDITVVLRDEFGQQQTRNSNSKGLVKFEVMPTAHIQLVVCGVSQTHKLSGLDRRIIRVGVEGRELVLCLKQ